MVVLAASVVTKAGKVLVSRQFSDMPRTRIEGLLVAFPKLLGTTEKQHTYFETENVRFVYQPVEATYLVLVTNKHSNICEDLDTLRLLSKVLENSCSLDEEGICKKAFELIFSFDEIISLGHKENVTLAQVEQFCGMESHEEKLQKLVMQKKINENKDAMRRKAIEIYKSKIDRSKSGYLD
uniref:coatomer subunit delta-3-like n=1 Tax=Fragaria vesca subsp. vesca TaxID=101020 RepID=UPI0005C853A2|nr:PREDICTED: coatomer subunit delta-3-like [Fragaria vesca subsp. vesca]